MPFLDRNDPQTWLDPADRSGWENTKNAPGERSQSADGELSVRATCLLHGDLAIVALLFVTLLTYGWVRRPSLSGAGIMPAMTR